MSTAVAMTQPVASTEIRLVDQQDGNAALLAAISRAAADPQVDVEKMERLMAMAERVEAKRAEVAFNEAMSKVQSAMRRIEADATNTQTRSKYATYGQLDRALRPLYTAEGFSLSFDTEAADDGFVGVVCYVSHATGHTRTYRARVPSDGKGAKGGDVMTKTHAFGSGASYGMRYLLKMIFNVAIGEDDDDGNGASDDDQTQAKRREWLEAVSECEQSKVALNKLKAECIKAYGGADSVDAAVRAAFVEAIKKAA